MKLSCVVSCLCVLYLTVVATEGSNATTAKTPNSKETDKTFYPKKVNSNKKNYLKTALKKSLDITDKFKDLSDDDLAFIKELDKQFKVHGEKVKIKVENKNVTVAKNNKRTIDGELGYGYHYDPPKFMFYPYSQQNIGSNDGSYYLSGDAKAEVSIEPSYSYELKPQSYITHNEPAIDLPKLQPQQHSEHYTPKSQQYEEPVIVLRIPGSAKYATHLQMLLQKYLEIRAAQYLHILEEAEQGNRQKQHQLEQLSYGYGSNGISHSTVEQAGDHHQPPQHVYTQQEQYDYQHGTDSQSVQYPEIDHVYHSYKNRHYGRHNQAQLHQQNTQSYYPSHQSGEEQQQNDHQQQDQHQYQHEHYQYQQQVQEQPQFYYEHQQQYAQPEGPPANTYQQVFLVAMTEPLQAHEHEASQGHHEEEQHHQQHQHQQHQQQQIYVQELTNQGKHASPLPVAENNPRPTHTKVVFTQNHEHSPHDYQMYQLPSIKPNDRHAPTSTPDFHQDFQHQQASSANYQQHYSAADTTDTGSPAVVAITQRPYNYHAHSVKARARGRTGHSRRAVTAKEADKGLQKIREYVRENLHAETGSAAELKASQVIDE